jgi:5-methyltetrahydrofolate--homocysteine methyltransferase
VGVRTVEATVEELSPFIDWTFFFHAWELKGMYPQILTDERYGEAATELFQHGKELLAKMATDDRLRMRGVYGFWPAAAEGDDVVLYTDAERSAEACRFPMLRQQEQAASDTPRLSLADFVAPAGLGLGDSVGAFAVTAGIGADELASEYEHALDDYNAIMIKALADRLAEAFAEMMHQRVRREWGIEAGDEVPLGDLIHEKYRGIRPAFGYQACPDHSRKNTLLELLGGKDVGITLTESYAMLPAAAVSGLYFAHPESRYFSVDRVTKDQIEDYARRKEMPVKDVERWLAPNLGYDPE